MILERVHILIDSVITLFSQLQKVNVTQLTLKNEVPNRFLSPTFADIPAPELKWEAMPPAPVPRLDGSAIQIKDLLYVIAGYGSLDHVNPLSFTIWIIVF